MESYHTYRIYSTLADLQSAEYGLWTYCRGVDVCGSGVVDIDLSAVLIKLRCGKSTFYRWLKHGLGIWFRHYRCIAPGQYRIYYASLSAVCVAFQIDDLGAIADVPIEALSRIGRKVYATELEILKSQHQAHYAATHQGTKADKAQVLDPSDTVDRKTSQFSSGAISPKYLKLEPNAPICPHTSIGRIAKLTGRAYSTIQRRLSNQWRTEKGFKPLPRLRVVRKLNPYQSESYLYNQKRESLVGQEFELNARSANWLINPKSMSYQFIRNLGDGLYFLGGNIYQASIKLRGCRWTRRKVKLAMAAFQTQILNG